MTNYEEEEEHGQSPLDHLYTLYIQNAIQYCEAISALNVKKILQFKTVKLPTPVAEKNIGLILMTVFSAFVDSSIKLTNDKS